MQKDDQNVVTFEHLFDLLIRKKDFLLREKEVPFSQKKLFTQETLAESIKVSDRTIRNIKKINSGEVVKKKPGKSHRTKLEAIADVLWPRDPDILLAPDPIVREWFVQAPYDATTRKLLYDHEQLEEESSSPIGDLIERIRRLIGLERKDITSEDLSLRWVLWNVERDRTDLSGKKYIHKIFKGLRLDEDLYTMFGKAIDDNQQRKELWELISNQGAYYAISSKPSESRPDKLYGRKDLIVQITEALENVNAVYLLGPPGIGKTHLAQEVLWRGSKRFVSSRAYISLANCKDKTAIKRAILEPFYRERKEKSGKKRERDEEGKQPTAIWLDNLVRQAKQNNGTEARIDKVLKRTLGAELSDPCLLILDDVPHSCIEDIRKIVANIANEFQSCLVKFIVIPESQGVYEESLRPDEDASNIANVLQQIGGVVFVVPPLSVSVSVAMLSMGVTAHLGKDSRSAFKKLALELRCYPPSVRLARQILQGNEETPFSLLLKLQADQASESVGEVKEQEDLIQKLVKQSEAQKRFEILLGFTYERLHQDAQSVFRQLSVFAETPIAISLEALQAVWRPPNGDMLSVESVHEQCMILEKAGLIQIEKKYQWCKLHSLVLRFARAKMKEDATPDEELKTVLRHAEHYGGLAANVDPTLPANYLRFSRERINVAQARTNLMDLISQASHTPTETNLAKFAEHTTYFESMSPSTALWRRDLLVKALDDENATSISWLMLHLGNTYVLMANSRTRVLYYDAIACYKTIVNFAQGSAKSATGAERYSRACAAAYIGLGSCYALLSDLAQDGSTDNLINMAICYLEEGEDTARLHQDRELMFYALCSLGDIYLKKYDQAKHEETNSDRLFANAYFQQTQSFALRDLRLQAILERKLGDACLVANNLSAATQHYHASRHIAEQINYPLAVYHAYVKEATVCQREGKELEAERLYQKAAMMQDKLFLPDDLPII